MTEPAHSALGASGAERWMNCPGSVALLKRLRIEVETEEADYQALGTHAHEALAHCTEQGVEAWEAIGQPFHGIKLEPDIAEAIQVELDERAALIRLLGEAGTYGVEYRISDPAVHEKFFGTVDFWWRDGTRGGVRDYKNGMLLVEVEHNPQVLYYAYGLLRSPYFDGVEELELVICQPRAFHPGGPVRRWTCSRWFIENWAETELKPAMAAADLEGSLQAGEWCRFCPAKLVCPLVTGVFGAMATASISDQVTTSDEELARQMLLVPPAEAYIKALKLETFARMLKGRLLDGQKLVQKKADRVWKKEAGEILRARFGADALTEPELKSPAQIDKLPGGKEFAKEWAYKPDTGLTMAKIDDPRTEVRVRPGSETFAEALKNLEKTA